MKYILSILLIFTLSPKDGLVNTVWQRKIAKGCFGTLKFLRNNKVNEYDCEMDYTFHNTYAISKDTIIVNVKDDSHPEDNGKVYYYKERYLLRDNNLYFISRAELINGKPEFNGYTVDKKIYFKKISK